MREVVIAHPVLQTPSRGLRGLAEEPADPVKKRSYRAGLEGHSGPPCYLETVHGPYVQVRCSGALTTLIPGDIIGRGWAAQLGIDDGRISEAHALVSLRGGELKLLALRGRFSVAGDAVIETVLRIGQTIALAPSIDLEILDVGLPDAILGLRTPHLPLTTMMGSCCLIEPQDSRLTPGFHARGAVNVWNRDADWRAKIGDETFDLVAGQTFEVEGVILEVVATALTVGEAEATALDRHTRPALRIVTHHDTVTIERSDGECIHLGGISARVLSELAEFDGPGSWKTIAEEIWDAAEEPQQLRRRWDVALARLRQRLRKGGVPANIIAADGKGNFELVLTSRDQVDCRG